MTNQFSIITPSAHTIKVKQDDAINTGDPRTSLAPAEMIIIDSAFGKVEVTICNGAVVVEVYQPLTGAQVGPVLHTSLADAFA